MAERFQKDKPKQGEFRDKVVYLGVKLKSGNDDENPTKTREFEERDQLGPVKTVVPKDLPNSIERPFQLVPTSPKSKEVVCKCGNRTTVGPQIRTVECRQCGHLQQVPA